MNRLLAIFIALLFWLWAAYALAQELDMKPLAGLSTEEAIAARKLARDRWSQMTPQQRFDTMKAARGKNKNELTALDQYARQQMALRYEGEMKSKAGQ